MQILAFGDSITYGSWDSQGGWADRLKRYAYSLVEHDTDWIEVYNLGIPGGRTDHLIERFASETNQRIDEGEQIIFLFAFGANDATFIESEQRFKVSPEDFSHNLRAAVDEAHAFSQDIALLTITPVNEAQASEHDRVRSNRFVEQYNAIIRSIASEIGCELIDAYAVFTAEPPGALLCDDGLHPNDAGHELLFSLVRTYIDSKLAQ